MAVIMCTFEGALELVAFQLRGTAALALVLIT